MKSERRAQAKNGHSLSNHSTPQTVTDKPAEQALMPETHPLADVVGAFADDPLWEEFLEEMERSRREIDAKFDMSK